MRGLARILRSLTLSDQVSPKPCTYRSSQTSARYIFLPQGPRLRAIQHSVLQMVGKVCCEPIRPIRPKRLGATRSISNPPGWASSHRRVTPSIRFAGTHLYTWVGRGTLRVMCLAQEHNTMSPASTRPV